MFFRLNFPEGNIISAKISQAEIARCLIDEYSHKRIRLVPSSNLYELGPRGDKNGWAFAVEVQGEASAQYSMVLVANTKITIPGGRGVEMRHVQPAVEMNSSFMTWRIPDDSREIIVGKRICDTAVIYDLVWYEE